MFEHYIVAGGGRRGKPWTFAVSVTAQAGLLAAVLAVPLMRVAPLVKPPDIVFFPYMRPPDPAVTPQPASPQTQSTATPLRPGIVFRAPTAIPSRVAMVQDTPSAPELPVGSALSDPSTLFTGILADASQHRMNAPPPPPPEARSHAVASPSGPIRIGGSVQSASLIHNPQPAYPPLAKQARISGIVRLSAYIGTDGRVRSLQLISGHPMLASAAIAAVSTWLYKPTLLNGQPVEVLTEIEVRFVLN